METANTSKIKTMKLVKGRSKLFPLGNKMEEEEEEEKKKKKKKRYSPLREINYRTLSDSCLYAETLHTPKYSGFANLPIL
jgi:hypothetical protein